MDRSMDSIGSCSLDVDAESTDISDTSGSLNFPTPISIKDITREFTANIRERCTAGVKSTTAYVDPVTGQVCIALTPVLPPARTIPATFSRNAPLTSYENSGGVVVVHNNNSHHHQYWREEEEEKDDNDINLTRKNALGLRRAEEDHYRSQGVEEEVLCQEHNNNYSIIGSFGGVVGGIGGLETIDEYQAEKKPSYLNLACCVSGYSNITTYNSKIRQDINKSRAVSPIRPLRQGLEYCKKKCLYYPLRPPSLLSCSSKTSIMPNIARASSPTLSGTAPSLMTATTDVMSGTRAGSGGGGLSATKVSSTTTARMVATGGRTEAMTTNGANTATNKDSCLVSGAAPTSSLRAGGGILKKTNSSCANYLRDVRYSGNGNYSYGSIMNNYDHNQQQCGRASAGAGGEAAVNALGGAGGSGAGLHVNRMSFVQQRVERLYGPGALAPSFYSPKKSRQAATTSIADVSGSSNAAIHSVHDSTTTAAAASTTLASASATATATATGNHVSNGMMTNKLNRNTKNEESNEFTRKHQELSPSKDYNQFRRKLNTNCERMTTGITAVGGAAAGISHEANATNHPSSFCASTTSTSMAAVANHDNNIIDLPCLRYLSQEFRAQLPAISPKRSFKPARTSPLKCQSPGGEESLRSPASLNTVGPLSLHRTASPVDVHPSGKDQHTGEAAMQSPRPNQNANAAGEQEVHSGGENVDADEVDRCVAKKNLFNDSKEMFTDSMDECNVSDVSGKMLSRSIGDQNHAGESGDSLAKDHKTMDAVETAAEDCTKSQLLPSTKKDTSSSNLETNGLSVKDDLPMENDPSLMVSKDGLYFLQILKSEQRRLLQMADEIEEYMEISDINEDVMGLLRSASGKARLLVSQKMKQFEGLCDNNINGSPEDKFHTKVDDLQGFWDMVHLQIDHIDEIFKEIHQIKANDWQRPTAAELPPKKQLTLKSSYGKSTSTVAASRNSLSNGRGTATGDGGGAKTPSAAALKREAQRQKLQEIKRRNREAMALARSAEQSSNPTDACSEDPGMTNSKQDAVHPVENQ